LDPYRECHINALDRVQKKKLPNLLKAREAQAGNLWSSVGRLHGYALYKAYNGERAWKNIAYKLQVPHYLSRNDHYWKIRARKQRKDVGKFSFVNTSRTTADWNQLPEEVFGLPPAKAHTFSKRVRKEVDRVGGEQRETK
jgi:hypothetical protein